MMSFMLTKLINNVLSDFYNGTLLHQQGPWLWRHHLAGKTP